MIKPPTHHTQTHNLPVGGSLPADRPFSMLADGAAVDWMPIPTVGEVVERWMKFQATAFPALTTGQLENGSYYFYLNFQVEDNPLDRLGVKRILVTRAEVGKS